MSSPALTLSSARESRRAGWLSRLIATEADPVQAVLRLTLGLVMLPHAAQKLFGWFGGFGLEGTYGYLTGTLGIPGLLAGLALVAEIAGAVGLTLGLLGRVAAFGIASVMVGAIVTSHLPYGFFMDWNGTLPGEGFEYHLLAIGLAVAVMVRGSGSLSVDRALSARQPE